MSLPILPPCARCSTAGITVRHYGPKCPLCHCEPHQHVVGHVQSVGQAFLATADERWAIDGLTDDEADSFLAALGERPRAYVVQQCHAGEWITLGVYVSRQSADRAASDGDFPDSRDYIENGGPVEVQEWPLLP